MKTGETKPLGALRELLALAQAPGAFSCWSAKRVYEAREAIRAAEAELKIAERLLKTCKLEGSPPCDGKVSP